MSRPRYKWCWKTIDIAIALRKAGKCCKTIAHELDKYGLHVTPKAIQGMLYNMGVTRYKVEKK